MSSVKWQQNRDLSILTTELNSLASTAAVLSAAIDNDSDLDTHADFELVVTFGSSPTNFSLVELYLVRTVDGTNYDDASATGPILPRNGFIGGFSVRNVTTAQRIVIPGVELPPRDFKLLIVNATNQAFPSSGNTLKAHTYRKQVA